MKRLSSEEIADQIRLDSEQVPALPTAFTSDPAYLDYLTSRIAEVRGFYRRAGLEPEYLAVTASTDLIAHFSSLRDYDGIAIDYVVNPLADALSADGLDGGTFTMEFSAFHPASTWIRPILGIAYATPVSPELYATRWTLQEIDGMEPEDASRAADLL